MFIIYQQIFFTYKKPALQFLQAAQLVPYLSYRDFYTEINGIVKVILDSDIESQLISVLRSSADISDKFSKQ